MAINPNELFYRGYNPATLYSGYDDVHALRKKSPPAQPAYVEEKNDERNGSGLYSGYGYIDNNWNQRRLRSQRRQPPVSQLADVQERRDENNGHGEFVPEERGSRNGHWFQRRPSATGQQVHFFQEQKPQEETKGIVELRMPLCCEGCVEKVQRKFKTLRGVASVECYQEKQKVIVRGQASPEEVLRRAQATWSRSSFWTEE